MAAAESTMMRQQQNIPLGDLAENGGGIDSLLPPRVVVGPDENGIRKVIRYCVDDEGNKFEVVTTITPVGKLARALSPVTPSSATRCPVPPTPLGMTLNRGLQTPPRKGSSPSVRISQVYICRNWIHVCSFVSSDRRTEERYDDSRRMIQ